MPPSHRSSSSHSSSRSSSSRSSGSRSSSSRSFSSHSSSSYHSSGSSYRSSSYSSGPSRHSSSSHGGYSSARSSAMQRPMPRPRQNQPVGYQTGIHGPAPREYHCRKHDYIYYGNSWYSDTTGMFHQKGYYDENGKRYDDIVIKDGQTVKFTCPYCDTEVKTPWTEGKKPTCPNCSAQMEEPMVDEIIQTDIVRSQQTEEKKSRRPRVWVIVVAVLALVGLFGRNNSSSGTGSPDTGSSGYIASGSQDQSLYVEELGRYCPWDASAESYYDVLTDCYFWFNDQIDVPQWQYWYEGISSDYGDYGWMEYDMNEARWYIETDAGQWSVLPDTYDTYRLWYIHG